MLIFPEGTRRDGGEPGLFRGGIHHLACAQPETLFVPVALFGFSRTLPKGGDSACSEYGGRSVSAED
ncbi:hypothetical protein KH017_08000 [bacterium]|nr:hypothetical protein [bacterium]